MTDDMEARIVAYVDNELDAGDRAGVEAAAAADPAVAARIEAHRALRARLSGAFGGVIDAPVPRALIDTALGASERPSAVVLPFKPRSGLVPHSFSVGGWRIQAGAMAACLVAGIALTLAVGGSRGDITSRSGILIARGALAQALSTQLASDVRGPVRLALTFRDHSGAVCRTFSTSALDGLACRDGREWRIDATSSSEEGARSEERGDYRQASSPLIVAAAQDRAEGDVFDATAETAARASGWKAIPAAK